jgi:hypothetical protein
MSFSFYNILGSERICAKSIYISLFFNNIRVEPPWFFPFFSHPRSKAFFQLTYFQRLGRLHRGSRSLDISLTGCFFINIQGSSGVSPSLFLSGQIRVFGQAQRQTLLHAADAPPPPEHLRQVLRQSVSSSVTSDPLKGGIRNSAHGACFSRFFPDPNTEPPGPDVFSLSGSSGICNPRLPPIPSGRDLQSTLAAYCR